MAEINVSQTELAQLKEVMTAYQEAGQAAATKKASDLGLKVNVPAHLQSNAQGGSCIVSCIECGLGLTLLHGTNII